LGWSAAGIVKAGAGVGRIETEFAGRAMKLPAIIKSAAIKLDKARAGRAKAEAAVAELQSKLDALDVEADDYATARQAIDAMIAVQEKSILVLNDQIARLDAKVADEERAAAAIRRAHAIRAVQSMLPERAKIVAEIEAAVKDLPGLFEKLAAWQRQFLKRYPSADLEYPYQHFLSDDRVLQRVTGALHAIRIEDAGEAIDGLAADEARQHADLIADLTGADVPVDSEAA
jgi:hypothetical protein